MVRFGRFVLDRRTWTISKDGELVDLSPRLVEILAHLISRGGEIVTKDELLERFWPDTYVEENTLARAIADGDTVAASSADRAGQHVAPTHEIGDARAVAA